MAELAGVMVGNYFLLECLGREGMVETYRARPTTRGGFDVVLRLFRPPFPDPTAFREHFAAEVEKVWRCHHPHIQPLLEFGAGDELLYSATLVPEAETLEQFLVRQQGRFLPIDLVLRFVTRVCAAVQYAHEQGIVHGNIQPSSVLVRNGEEVQLTNFNMKRAYQDGEPVAAQIDEGNPAYTAPEQALGMIRPASDIYALGILLYRLLTGRLPYEGEDPGEITLKHADEPIPSLRASLPELPEPLELVVRVALAKSPEARFPSAAAFAQALLSAIALPSDDQEVASVLPPRRIVVQSRRTAFTWARAASLLTLVMLLFGLMSASFFIFSLPQRIYDLPGLPFWGGSHSGGTPARTAPAAPPSVSGTVTSTTNTPVVGSKPPSSQAPTPIASGTVVPGPTAMPTPTSSPSPVVCASGALSIDGSPNLEPLLSQVSSDYQALCPGITILLGGDGSRPAIGFLQGNQINMADSDLTVLPQRNLTDHPVAALLYALIVSPDVQVSGLSSSEIQGIYQGQITNWTQVGGPDEAITVFLRSPADAIAAIFRTFVLNGQSEHVHGIKLKKDWSNLVAQAVAQMPGAISYVPLVLVPGNNVQVLAIDGVSPSTQALQQGTYPFWSIEHFYTQGAGTAQAQAYMAFFGTAQEIGIMGQFAVVPIGMLPQNVLASHLPGPEI